MTATGNPLISVVVPLYNKEKYVRRAVDSVLGQTFRDFELIVVNDGSTDNGPAVVREYTDPRIRVIDQENRGVSAARNRGIAEATGELIAFLDADDEWLPDFLDTIIQLRRKYPVAGAYVTGWRLLKDEKGTYREVRVRGETDSCGCYFDLVRSGAVANSSCIAVRRHLIDQIGGFDATYQRGEDAEMWFRIGLQYDFACSPRVCSIYHFYLLDNACHSLPDEAVSPLYQWLQRLDTDPTVSSAMRTKASDYLARSLALETRRLIVTGTHAVRKRRLREYRRMFGITPAYVQLCLLSLIPRPLLHSLRLWSRRLTGRAIGLRLALTKSDPHSADKCPSDSLY